MEYSIYSLENITEYFSDYDKICACFFELAFDDEMRNKLESVLYEGKYKDFFVCSRICNIDDLESEVKRRVAMAYLLVRNPDTFDVLVDNNINLFHGTDVSVLPSILKYGLNSGAELEKMGINVSTGEKWSRKGGKQRDFISFTDVLDVAEEYSCLSSSNESDSLSFEVLIGTTANDVIKIGRCNVSSEITEVSVKKKFPLENIRVIGVSSEKIDYVKRLVLNKDIIVVAIDDIRNKFYGIDEDLGKIYIYDDELKKFKNRLNEPKKKTFFLMDEMGKLTLQWLTKEVTNNGFIYSESGGLYEGYHK